MWFRYNYILGMIQFRVIKCHYSHKYGNIDIYKHYLTCGHTFNSWYPSTWREYYSCKYCNKYFEKVYD